MHTADRLARAIAYVVNPLVLPPLLFASVLALYDAPPAEIGLVAGIAAMFFTGLPLALLFVLLRTGRAASIELFDRKARRLPYAVGFAGTLAAFFVVDMTVQTARPIVLALAGLLCGGTALMAIINLRWKISLHAASITGFVTMLLYAASRTVPPPSSVVPAAGLAATGLAAAGLVGAVMWARLRSNAHTPGEVWAGMVFGLAVPFIVLLALEATGRL
ncbi:MAG: hypothetical protein WD021_11175 [Rhodothermales bacterium]